MNIGVYIHEYDPSVGGGFTFVDTIFNAFLETSKNSRQQFTIFCTASARKAVKEKLTSSTNVNLTVIPRHSWINSLLVTLKHFFPITVPLLHRFNPIDKICRKQKIDLVWFVGGWAYDTLDTPYVATVWDLQHRTHPWFPEVSARGRWEYRENVYSRFLKRASHIITGTAVGKQQLGWYYQVPENQISIIPHPVPSSGAKTKGLTNKDLFVDQEFLKKPFFFYPAQFWAHKNHVNLLHALKVLKDKYKHDVNIAFTGSDKGNLTHVLAVARQLGVEKNIFPLGFVSEDQLIFLYRNSIALTYVSFSGPENLPPLEAFSLNCPVINSDFPGAREQLGEAALYVNPHDPDDIALKLNNLIQNPNMRNKLVEEGKIQVQARNADKFVEKVFTIFNNFELVRRTWQ